MKRYSVLIDGYFYGRPSGFGRVIFELCRALGQLNTDVRLIVAIPDTIDRRLLPKYDSIEWHVIRKRNFITWEQFSIPWLARQLGCDTIHFPYNTAAAFTYGIKKVVTVHDLFFFETNPRFWQVKEFIAAHYINATFHLVTKRADCVVAVSRTTAAILKRIGVNATVIYNTVDGFTSSLGREAAVGDLPEGGILHRGGYSEHRNTLRVIKAFLSIRNVFPDLRLNVLGAPNGADVWQLGDDSGISFMPYLSEQALARLYAKSKVVVVTSLREGFGLPIIESFGFGVPVITSNVDPMREVAGCAAVLVDPTNVSEIGDAMRSILSDPELARSLVDKGHCRSKDFASARVAELHLQVYQGQPVDTGAETVAAGT